jgi:hypothetical protein
MIEINVQAKKATPWTQLTTLAQAKAAYERGHCLYSYEMGEYRSLTMGIDYSDARLGVHLSSNTGLWIKKNSFVTITQIFLHRAVTGQVVAQAITKKTVAELKRIKAQMGDRLVKEISEPRAYKYESDEEVLYV